MARKRWDILIDLIQREDLKTGAEIGVKAGRNMSRILARCPWFQWIAVDPWDTTLQYQTWDPKSHAKNEREFDKLLKQRPSIRKIKAYSVDAAKQVEDESLDLVFIDAMHTYEHCKADILAWRPKLKPGGWLTGHDYHHPRFPGVTEAVDEFLTVKTSDDYVWLSQV